MDKDDLLLAALYDGNGNRVFTMECAPELAKNEALRVPAGQDREEERKPSETDESETDDDGQTGSGMPEDLTAGNRTAGAGEAAEENTGNRNTGSKEGASGGRYPAVEQEKKVGMSCRAQGKRRFCRRAALLRIRRMKTGKIQEEKKKRHPEQGRKGRGQVKQLPAGSPSGTACSARRRISSCLRLRLSRHGSTIRWALGIV